tara:strand:+ start:88 stop:384 length:297 start_codon:yes stop_codon:yes gene_type:complete
MEEQEEIWYDIEEFPHYQISNLKNVRRLPYKVQVEVTVEAAEINPQKSGMVFFFYNWPKRSLTSRSLNVLYKRYVLGEEPFKQKKASKRRKKQITPKW